MSAEYSPAGVPEMELQTAKPEGLFASFRQSLCRWLKRFFGTPEFSNLYQDRLKNRFLLRHVALAFGRINQQSRKQFHQILQQRFDLDPVHLHRFFDTPLGNDILNRFSELVHGQANPEHPALLRGALLQTASDPEGFSILDFFQRLSTHIPLNPERLIVAVRRVELLLRETEAIVAEIGQLATAAVTQEPEIDGAQLPDLGVVGDRGVDCQQLSLRDRSRDRQFQLVLYTPQRWRKGKTPVIVISHGLGSGPDDFIEYAEHLASYGYVVAVPQHPGSDLNHIAEMLAGTAPEFFQLQEFIDRPLDISYVLDELERRNAQEYESRLNLQTVGAIGHSFGGYTVLALAGAGIDFEKLELACGPINWTPNISMLLQCRALNLPRQAYSFRDPRVAAVLTIDPVGSEVFGPRGFSQIEIPALLIAGSEDRTAPAILEQLRIFSWLASPERYLALIEGKPHLGNFSRLEAGVKFLLFKVLPNLSIADLNLFHRYACVVSLAFLEMHISQQDRATYQPYLQAAYAAYLSQSPMNLYLLNAAAAESLRPRLQTFMAKLAALN